MAIKKSQIYSWLWESCDELRGGMDASQYKDYVLTLLFVKYVSDKYAGDPNALIEVPEGGGFADILKLKGDREIGDKINKIIGKLAEANDLKGVINLADFNDESKLGLGQEMRDKLSNLVAIFEEIDLSSNRLGGDDLLGDAYEYLMTNFATESGKSKGQFYTPAEVSRVIAKVVGIGPDTRQDETIYDPTCGSGSLLLRAANEAPGGITIYGQEMDNVNWSLAMMNMFLHGQATAELWRGNTLAAPYFKNDAGGLKTFDFAVANPPFSFKGWANGLDPTNDEFRRFEYGVPPPRNGDYAFLLHLTASLNSRGQGAIIMPHGVLFRGNREADIRRNLLQRGLIKGVIGLPANLFYGTGIPACIIVIDKEDAHSRDEVFIIDASFGFIKEGPKNRLREQDIHKIVDTFNRSIELPHYSRMVPLSEIANTVNSYNLNIPRYVDSSESEDLHDLDAHINGGIPNRDIDALNSYWKVFPELKSALFSDYGRDGYSEVSNVGKSVRDTVLEHDEFVSYQAQVASVLDNWRSAHEPLLMRINETVQPQIIIQTLSEGLLTSFRDIPLLDPYGIYQRMMDYWNEEMQDDIYLLASNGWAAGRMLRTTDDREAADFSIKRGRTTYRFVCDLVPALLVVARFFKEEKQALERLEGEVRQAVQHIEEFEEENSVEGGALHGLEGQRGITKTNVRQRAIELKETILSSYPAGTAEHEQAKGITKTGFGNRSWPKGITDEDGLFEELDTLHEYIQTLDDVSIRKTDYQEAWNVLWESVIEKYAALTDCEIKMLVVHDKWFANLKAAIEEEEMRLPRQLSIRLGELGARYARSLPELEHSLDSLNAKVKSHIKRLGVAYGQ